jgi:AraC-like DNA-binding protein
MRDQRVNANTEARPASLLTQAYLLENFGLRLTVDQLASVLHMARNTVYNQVAAGTFSVPTYVDGGKRFADYRDVAKYLDECRERARSPA